jgi:hypothetical protein
MDLGLFFIRSSKVTSRPGNRATIQNNDGSCPYLVVLGKEALHVSC